MVVTFKKLALLVVAIGILALASVAVAKQPAEKAELLKTELTPFGAERAGNAEGAIPAWDGGLTAIPPNVNYDPESGDLRPDPFADDQILFTITAQNVDQYKDKLSAGQIALLGKYPDTYKINVYPTRRTIAAPQWVYDNTYQNAVKAELTEDKLGARGAYGGIPFPMPTQGAEVVINHNAKWEGGGDTSELAGNYIIQASGSITNGGTARYYFDRPFYEKDKNVETWNQWLIAVLFEYSSPARRKGEIILSKNPLNYTDKSKAAWQYMTGQRRVRRAPSIDYDTPNPSAGGLYTYDDAYSFNGPIDRFEWKLVGKKEMFIPYNNYQFDMPPLKTVLTRHHANPDYVRWELHRVWVVEATLKEGKRHIYGRRILHMDEDSWFNAVEDKYDTRGNLWRTSLCTNYAKYDGGNVIGLARRAGIYYDFQGDSYAAGYLVNGLGKNVLSEKPNPPEWFEPAHVRKLGRR
ncbi:conserved uncharacterized protein, DUF1329 [Desulfosarcina variabilis str. Montpellier]|uniref:DUF1329 domain-containing protein n=1 Tax=Desulfosarcina variabilis TaxID=2300 RepID=UPI003AFAF736